MRIVTRNPHSAYLDNWLWLPKFFVNVDGTKNALTFGFPDGRSEKKMRFVYLWKETQHHLLVPRHFWDLGSLPFPVLDCRPATTPRANIRSRIKLDHRPVDVRGVTTLQPTGSTVQRDSLAALAACASGILQLACGKGKSVVALERIAQSGGRGLIVVDNTQLVEHWKREIATMLDVPTGVGELYGGKVDWDKDIVIATYQTLAAYIPEAPEEFRRMWAVVVWDEGHHISAPTFAPGAEYFFCQRIALTATPKRQDGTHVIYNMHIGPVVFKDLKQDLVARVAFDWTGLSPEETRPNCAIRDKSGEIHLGMLSVYFGKWVEHLNHVLRRVWEAVQEGRRILVLCDAVDEAVNLCALWNRYSSLYTDVPIPTPQDVGETLQPIALEPKQREAREQAILHGRAAISAGKLSNERAQQLALELYQYEQELKQCDVHDKVQKELRRRQREYLKAMQSHGGTGGLMIYKVPPEKRQSNLDTKQVVFAIKKYGREGLNNRHLDTVITTMPFSQDGTLQQVRGRVERFASGKREPLLLVIEHNVGPIIGMCQKLRKHLREWPVEEGGPFTYELHNHPRSACNKKLFGSS